jgi:hypothetical protein
MEIHKNAYRGFTDLDVSTDSVNYLKEKSCNLKDDNREEYSSLEGTFRPCRTVKGVIKFLKPV